MSKRTRQSHEEAAPSQRPLPLDLLSRRPERLVGFGFRCWLAGFQTRDIDCWQYAWCEVSHLVGCRAAKPIMTELACFVRAVHVSSTRAIEVYPSRGAGFCRDECLAISMIAASQHSNCPAMRACAFALMGASAIDEAVNRAHSFGESLRSERQILSPESICNAACFVSGGPAMLSN